MHYALPPRKTSFPPAYVRISDKNVSEKRRKQLQYLGTGVLSVLTLILLLNWFRGHHGSKQHGPIKHDSSVVIVTVFDEKTMSPDYISMIKQNRDDYAVRHGYRTFYTNSAVYMHLVEPSPASWTLVPALRHTLTLFPDTDYLWSLSPHALIMDPATSLHDRVFANLTSLMLKDIPVVPPDSVIHTFSHLKPSQVALILAQDGNNIAHTSFILRNTAAMPVAAGESKDYWSHYFLDAWFDPLYRAYAFQKAENHALEHIVQWHPTILAKLVLVQQNVINSYTHASAKDKNNPTAGHEALWKQGDLVANFHGCTKKDRDCEKEMKEYFDVWQNQVLSIGGLKVKGA